MATLRTGYLGPEGSFSHEAVSTMENVTPVACDSLVDLLSSVADSTLDQGLVPLENAIEGTVSATIDGLVFDHDLVIVREIVIPIRLHLLARPGVATEDLTGVRSYVHALAQCRSYLHTLDVDVTQSTSTSQAAREVAESTEPWAAVASTLAGQLFGLVALATDIEDHPDNVTRFVVVGREHVAAATGHDRTTIVCFQDADRPGSLYAILGRFAARDINLTKLESRPTKRGLGDYCFVIEFEGHVADDVVADCLADLQAHLTRVKFLGSYPVTGDDATDRREAVAEARRSADEWIKEIRSRITS
ncbi:MAG TPA: prephenate dehydratase [Acidimicrobiales bacterium]|jgi:prephenate dehydratase|nr:prephenate dehydratase [Acidimicrobiales bacterium]